MPSQRYFSTSLSTLFVLVATVACSGNSNLGGGDGTVAGTGQGGSNSAKGGSNPGGGSSNGCTLTECFRNVRCVTRCGGPVVQDGCCPCPTGTFDDIQCSATGGAATANGGTGNGGTGNGGTGNGGTGNGGTGNGSAATGGGVSAGGAVAAGGAAATGGGLAKGGATVTGGTSAIGGAVAKGGGGANATGGAATQGGANTMGGAVVTGGSSSLGGSSAGNSGVGGASPTGGSASVGGAGSLLECRTSADCKLVGDCCGCHSLPLGKSSDCPMDCLSSTTCTGFNPQPVPACIHGRCVLDRSCDDANTSMACLIVTPTCAAGKLPSLNTAMTCYDTNCIDVPECGSVRSCADCKSPTQICVIDNGARAVYHCVEVAQSCMLASRCACYGDLCGNMLPCAEHSNGIYCGGG